MRVSVSSATVCDVMLLDVFDHIETFDVLFCKINILVELRRKTKYILAGVNDVSEFHWKINILRLASERARDLRSK